MYLGLCFFCGFKNATVVCEECNEDFGARNRMAYCDSCYNTGHSHKRTNHVKEPIVAGPDLELLSVLCIETSHYVCFTKTDDHWLFFDSMFDRKCKLRRESEVYGYRRPSLSVQNAEV